MKYDNHIIIIVGAFVVGGNILVGILQDSLLYGFSAIAFAILFHAMAADK